MIVAGDSNFAFCEFSLVRRIAGLGLNPSRIDSSEIDDESPLNDDVRVLFVAGFRLTGERSTASVDEQDTTLDDDRVACLDCAIGCLESGAQEASLETLLDSCLGVGE